MLTRKLYSDKNYKNKSPKHQIYRPHVTSKLLDATYLCYKMQLSIVDMRERYVNMHLIYVDMQLIYIYIFIFSSKNG